LCKYRATPHDAPSCPRTLGRSPALNVVHTRTDLVNNVLSAPELGWDRHRKRDAFRHGPRIAEEVEWSARMDFATRNELAIRVNARPVVRTCDQTILHWIRRGIDEFVDECFTIEQSCDAWVLGRPEVLPATSKRVLTSSEQLVKVLDELGAPSIAIEDHRMVVV
jgi:hypothetical protein